MASIWTNAKDLIGPPKPKQQDPMELLLGSGGGPSSADLYAEALAQVGNAYQAQIGALNGAEADAKKRQQQGDAQLAAMYSSLAKDIGKNEGTIKGYYGSATGNAKKYGADAKNAINRNYQQTNNELAGLFSRLGIQAAMPDAVAGSSADRNLLTSITDAAANNSLQALNTDQAAALGFNRAQQNIAGLTGKNKRSDLLDALNERLGAIGDQRNQVYGSMADAVAQRQYQLEQDSLQQQQQMADMMYKMYGDQPGGSDGGGGLTANQEYQQMGPNERGRYKAATLFGEGQAPYVMQLLEGVANYQNGGVYQNLPHFIRSVIAENHKQQEHGQAALSDELLADLASYFWDQGGTGRNLPKEDYSQQLY